MAMGTRKKRERQEDLWVVSSEIEPGRYRPDDDLLTYLKTL
jgi:hypothetical protein